MAGPENSWERKEVHLPTLCATPVRAQANERVKSKLTEEFTLVRIVSIFETRVEFSAIRVDERSREPGACERLPTCLDCDQIYSSTRRQLGYDSTARRHRVRQDLRNEHDLEKYFSRIAECSRPWREVGCDL
jgi:hypothetical protein